MYKAMVRHVEENKEPGEFLILEIPVREAAVLSGGREHIQFWRAGI